MDQELPFKTIAVYNECGGNECDGPGHTNSNCCNSWRILRKWVWWTKKHEFKLLQFLMNNKQTNVMDLDLELPIQTIAIHNEFGGDECDGHGWMIENIRVNFSFIGSRL